MAEGLIGQTVSHYRIVKKLGEGGMGEVYLAEDLKLLRKVAVKFLARRVVEHPDLRRRFELEARAAASLDHPNICTVHAIEEHEDQMFIVMAYIEGHTVEDQILEAAVPLGRALDLTVQAAQGLQEAHRRGVIHRDIKSSNLMVTPDGLVKLMDFGLARLSGETRITQPGVTPGTPAYMSPEQILGKELDSRTDLWSLGVVLYEMLTRKLPFGAEHHQALVYCVLNEEPSAVTTVQPDLPGDVEGIVSRCLEKRPEDRYPDAASLLKDLRALQRAVEGVSAGARVSQETGSPSLTQAAWGAVPKARDSAGGTSRRRFLWGAPVAAAGLASAGWWMFGRGGGGSSLAQQASLAVLPFTPLSGDPEDEYFCDGLTEELINVFAQIGGLRVVARTSAFVFKGKSMDVREIGRQLNVETVLEGSLRRYGKRLRVSGQLVNVADGFQLWSRSYDREAADAFEIQHELARSIVDALQLTLIDEGKLRLSEGYTDNLQAMQHYWKGLHQWNRQVGTSIFDAVEEFRMAIREDPQFALPYAEIVKCFVALAHGGSLSPQEAGREAAEAAGKAMELDDGLPQAHTALACVRAEFERDWAGSDASFRRALELRPGDGYTRTMYVALLLLQTERFDEARRHIQRALDMDPLSIPIQLNAASIALFEGRYDQAVREFQAVHEVAPNHWIIDWGSGLAWIGTREYDQAIEAFERARVSTADAPLILGILGGSHGLAGNHEEARELLRLLEELAETSYVSPLHIAWAHIGLGDLDRAFEFIEKAYELRAPLLNMVKVFPIYNHLRDDPRLIAVVEKLGLNSVRFA